MKKLLIILTFCFFTNFAIAQSTTWVIDPTHSSVNFEVPHLTVSTVSGYFTDFSGTAFSEGDDFHNAEINAVIDVASITTHNLERDKHLKEDDFFNTNQFPNITFKSNTFRKTEDGSFEIYGDLTIRDITKPVVLEADFAGIVLLDDQKKAGFTAKGKINRFDYGLKWDDALDSGGLIVGEEVDLILNITLVQQ